MTRVIVRIEVPSTACTVLAEYLHDAISRVARTCDAARRALHTLEMVNTLYDEIGPDEVATDREFIDSMGNRRPRPSVVHFFEYRSRHAHEWLNSYMAHTQRELGLDIDLMNEVKEGFLVRVHQAIQARQPLQAGRQSA